MTRLGIRKSIWSVKNWMMWCWYGYLSGVRCRLFAYVVVAVVVVVIKGKVFPYSLQSVGPGADPGVQAVSPHVMWSESRHIPDSRLPFTFCQAYGYPRSFHQMALPVNGSTHLIPAYYSIYRSRKDKGWVGLVGWPIADGLPKLVVTHQLQVECRTGKVRRPETDVLPLCHATNL